MGTSETRPTESPLRRARRERGERLEDVARRAEISTSYLSMAERGLEVPPPVRARLAAALETTEEELFG